MTSEDPFATAADLESPPPVFPARYNGDCTWGCWIEEGDLIRADGYGGWECASHAE